MDTNSLFSALSFFSVIIYMHIGSYAYSQNRKSLIHKVFLLLCVSYAVWSFSYAFVYVSVDPYTASLWNKIAAIGWCSFSSISLYLVLLITENRLSRSFLIKCLIFLPAGVFFYMAVFLFGPDIRTPELISKLFYIGNFLYNFILLFLSILLIFLWGRRSSSCRVKKQANILVACSMIPFALDLLTQTFMPLLGFSELPLIGQLYAVIMIIGTYHVITRYNFLKLPEKVLLDEIQDKIFEMVIVLDSRLRIVKISKQVLTLLDYEEQDLIEKGVAALFDEENIERYRLIEDKKRELRFEDISVIGRNDIRIPANIYYIPIYDEDCQDFMGALLIMQDIRIQNELKIKNEMLYEKTIRDSLTNLYNYQYMIERTNAHIAQATNDGHGSGSRSGDELFSLIMIDIDYFKKVNDTYGHLFGDHVLRTFSDILTGIIGGKGYAGRYGGEEFIVLLPEHDAETAYAVGEEIRKAVAENRFDRNLRITISAGVQQYCGGTCDQLIHEADILLYKAKQNGRNRVEVEGC
jgi:diguanylate cyclase (GGDEF)-like protein